MSAATIVLTDGETNEVSTGDGSTSIARVWNVGFGGITMTVSGRYYLAGTFSNANTTQFGASTIGLGVCNPFEACTFNDWQIDNSGARDFLYVTFSAPVNIANFVITQTTQSFDSDAVFATGNGLTLNQLLSIATLSSGGTLTPGQSRTITINGNNVTQLLIGVPGTGGAFDNNQDFWKAYSIDVNPVPEPGSMALLGSGLLGLGVVVHRRRRK